MVDEKSPELPEDERAAIAHTVGIGAVKYADLSTTRQRDLVFSFDRMLALDGNTAPYLLYAGVRAASIDARAGESSTDGHRARRAAERALVLKLTAFADAVDEVDDTLEPHLLCTYLYELAGAFTTFYDTRPVLKAPEPETRLPARAVHAHRAR